MNLSTMAKVAITAGSICLLLLVVPISLYIWKFGTSLSTKQDDWVAFASYLNVFISIISIIAVSTLTYTIYSFQQKDEANKAIPVLIFEYIDNSIIIHNVGNGVALNILISYSSSENHNWKQPYKVHSMAQNTQKPITFLEEVSDRYIACYNDYLGNKFSSIYENNDTKLIKGTYQLKDFITNYIDPSTYSTPNVWGFDE